MVKSPNIQARLDAISKELANGASPRQFIPRITKKYKVSVETVNKDIRRAKQKAHEAQELKQRAEADALYEATKEAEKRRIMNADERKEYLTKLIEGKRTVKRLFVIDGEITEHLAEPDAADKIRAIAELNKMGGDYAPTKVANTDKEGNNVYCPPTINIYTMPPPEEAD